MKKVLSYLLSTAFLCTLILTGCRQTPVTEETEPATEAVTEAATEAVTEAATEPVEPEVELPETDLYLVGGSIVCNFPYDNGFFTRYGFGTQLGLYLNKSMVIHNLAVSGTTSSGYHRQDEYSTLESELGEGDYLMIIFGGGEFSDAAKAYTENRSFGNNLYKNYIQLAEEKGAVPILVTPPVKLDPNDDYTGESAHITSTGDYRQAILDMGAALNVPVVDLTAITKERYETLGYEEAVKYHAADEAKYTEDGILTTDPETVDTVCLNYYGAKYVAYRLACELQKIEGIGEYVKKGITEPVVDTFVPNPYYEAPHKSPESVETNVYLVGDSTVSPHYDRILYPRYGYGTQIANYLTENVAVDNLAVSGSSSKSFITWPQYETLKTNLKAGDYLIIGFGHNDHNNTDPARFTKASADYTDPESFGYYLYECYIKLAREVGATPILCTPIVYVSSSDTYTGSTIHNTVDGDYRQVILDVGAALDVPVVDLTGITKARYEEIGYEEVIKYHAVEKGGYAEDGVTVIIDKSTVDGCHLNIYGASYVAYRLACELQNIEGIREYVAENLEEPTEELLKPYPYYVFEPAD